MMFYTCTSGYSPIILLIHSSSCFHFAPCSGIHKFVRLIVCEPLQSWDLGTGLAATQLEVNIKESSSSENTIYVHTSLVQ